MNKEKSNIKKRYWTFILYPESAPSDWMDKLQETGLEIAVSPLHNMDNNPDGEVKKEHYHIIMCYNGPTTYNAVKSFIDTLNCPIPKPLDSIKGMYRYFIHKDNPEKYQYDEKDILHINGFDIQNFCELTRKEVNEIKIKIQLFIREYDIFEYAHLMDLLLDNEMYSEYDIACNNTFFFDRYISSRRHSDK